MPIYEYQCRQCGHGFEYLKLASSPAAECPACRSSDLKQLISLSAMSSEGSRAANFTSARNKASGARKEKQSEDHQHLHEHFEDDRS
jgi:putative FmdB family regulatory protein